ncbi:MAG: hypothetical protein CL812_12635 [Confluentimicrobium sp.]|nr:hypothetical protein [Actibacterium sp.]|tara:strand:+ start:681 stop:929 length:249 start_codon:yes stop_codon:yes gene_type:complete
MAAKLAEQTLPSHWKFSSFVKGDCPYEPGVAPGNLEMTSKLGTRPNRRREDWAMTAWSRPRDVPMSRSSTQAIHWSKIEQSR